MPIHNFLLYAFISTSMPYIPGDETPSVVCICLLFLCLQGGPALQSQGLQCAVSNEQYAQLATAEIIPPVHSYVTAKVGGQGAPHSSSCKYL